MFSFTRSACNLSLDAHNADHAGDGLSLSDARIELSVSLGVQILDHGGDALSLSDAKTEYDVQFHREFLWSQCARMCNAKFPPSHYR